MVVWTRERPNSTARGHTQQQHPPPPQKTNTNKTQNPQNTPKTTKQIPDARERGQCYSVFNIDGERMASYYAPVSRLEDALLGGAAVVGPRMALAEKAKAKAAADAAAEQQQQRAPLQQRRPQPSGGGMADDGGANPLAFLARFFFPPGPQ